MSRRRPPQRRRARERNVQAAARPAPDRPTRRVARVFCTACGTENLPGSHFCANCGAALPAAASGADTTSAIGTAGSMPELDTDFSAEAHQGAVDALTPGSALLVVKRGPNAGSRFLLDQ